AFPHDGQASARRQWQLAANDGVPAHQPLLGAEQMHRATPAAGHAGLAAEELGHDAVRLDTAGDGVAVLTVVSEQVVIWLHASRQANARGLLTQIEVAVTADLGSLVHLRRLLFEATDE